LQVAAFDKNGQPVTDARVTLIPLDTGLIVLPGGFIKGDRIRTSPVNLVAQVQRGGDILQTPPIGIDVVPRPDTVTPAVADTLAVKTYTLSGAADTAQVTSEELTVTLRNRARLAGNLANATVRSWIVRYEVTSQPAGANGATTAFISGTGAPQVSVDTTDASGAASRKVVLRTSVLTRPLAARYEVKVTVTVRERGQNVPGSPIEFVVPFEIRPAP
jgi:D-alanyl-D-alanine carboxypeptidase